MQALFRRSPSDGVTGTAGGCPAVLSEAPVRAEEASGRVRPRTYSSSSINSSSSNSSNQKQDMCVNYMVLGETGLGKTTFIYNLVSGFKVLQPGRAHLGDATSMHQFKSDPNSLRTVLAPLELSECGSRLIITIQDMPGWGEDINLRRYLRSVIAFVLSRRAKDFDMLNSSSSSKIARAEVCSSTQLRHSVTACLYFLPPHRIKHVDLMIMAAVSQLVTVIPVLAKSDAMTAAEIAAYRQEVAQILREPSKYVPEVRLQDLSVRSFAFDRSTLKRIGVEVLPLSVSCSRAKEACHDEGLLTMVGPHGLYRPVQPVRQYAWGAVYPLAREHQSDMIPLKRLLLGDQVASLSALLEDSYRRYTMFCEDYEDYSHELAAVVQEAWKLCKPLEFDDYPTVRAFLDRVQTSKKQLQHENKLLAEKLKRAEAERAELKERCWR